MYITILITNYNSARWQVFISFAERTQNHLHAREYGSLTTNAHSVRSQGSATVQVYARSPKLHQSGSLV